MKICIVTVPHVKNYGAVLMCHATQKLFEQHGFEVEFLDFLRIRPEESDTVKQFYRKLTYKGKHIVPIKAAFTLLQMRTIKKRARAFNEFVESHLTLSPVYYADSEDKVAENPPEADIYCTGGDQMWNEMYNFRRTLKTFYLDFAPVGKPRISFSTSIGKSRFDDWETPEVKPLLEKYSLISVREESGKKALDELGLESTYHIQDPTLIFQREQWEALAAPRMYKEPYILIYQLVGNKEFDTQAGKLAKALGCKLIRLEYSIYKKYIKKGHCEVLPSPEEFISLIKHAECIVTDSFHGTAFSVNLNRPFISVYPPHTSTRIESLLKLCGLTGRHYAGGDMMDIYNIKTDYRPVNAILEKERERAHEFIRKAKKLVFEGENDESH